MARPSEQDLPKLGPWPKGANNLADETSVPRGSVRRAINVDFFPSGKTRRRQGSQKLITAVAAALWSDGSYAMYRDGADLKKFVPGQSATTLYTGLLPDCDMTYCSVNQYVRVTDGRTSLRVNTMTDVVQPWGIASPAGQPTLSASSNGGLDAGAYQVAITFITALGEESGTGLAASITLTEGQGIALSAIPQPMESHVTSIALYMSRAGGTQLLYVTSVAVGTTSYTLLRQALGKELGTQFLSRMPVGQAAAFCNARLFVADGNLLMWSPPLQYGLTKLDSNYVAYAQHIDMAAPVSPGAASTGLFVGSGEKTFFLSGADPKGAANLIAYHNGVVPNSLVYVPGSSFDYQLGLPVQPLPMWVATNGMVCVGTPGGTVLPVTDGRYALGVGSRSAAMYREYKGIRQAVFTMEPPTSQAHMAYTDSASVTVVRNGIQI